MDEDISHSKRGMLLSCQKHRRKNEIGQEETARFSKETQSKLHKSSVFVSITASADVILTGKSA